MLKSDIQYPPHRQYKSKTEWEPLGFFSDCLCNSTRFDLMLGFFSSSAIRTLSDGFALFLYNGGTMRLIINNILSVQDKDAIIASIRDNSTTPFDLTNIEQLQNTLSKKDRHFFECLSWLITNKRGQQQISVYGLPKYSPQTKDEERQVCYPMQLRSKSFHPGIE